MSREVALGRPNFQFEKRQKELAKKKKKEEKRKRKLARKQESDDGTGSGPPVEWEGDNVEAPAAPPVDEIIPNAAHDVDDDDDADTDKDA